MRERHRCVTVIVDGDTGQTLAIIEHRSNSVAVSTFLVQQGHRSEDCCGERSSRTVMVLRTEPRTPPVSLSGSVWSNSVMVESGITPPPSLSPRGDCEQSASAR